MPGAKNSVLKLMAAALLAEGTSTFDGVPDIVDVQIMAELLRRLGCDGRPRPRGRRRRGRRPRRRPVTAPTTTSSARMRASICVLGPLVARCGVADVALPGGDAIGSRGLDMHIAGLQRLGAVVHVDHGFLVAEAPEGLIGAHVRLEFPSVGATENLLTAAVLARRHDRHRQRRARAGDRRPGLMLGAWARASRASRHLDPDSRGRRPGCAAEHRVVPDRIVAGTWAFAAALTGGDIVVRNGEPGHLRHGARQDHGGGRDGESPARRVPGAGPAPGAGGRRRRPCRTRASRRTFSPS